MQQRVQWPRGHPWSDHLLWPQACVYGAAICRGASQGARPGLPSAEPSWKGTALCALSLEGGLQCLLPGLCRGHTVPCFTWAWALTSSVGSSWRLCISSGGRRGEVFAVPAQTRLLVFLGASLRAQPGGGGGFKLLLRRPQPRDCFSAHPVPPGSLLQLLPSLFLCLIVAMAPSIP